MIDINQPEPTEAMFDEIAQLKTGVSIADYITDPHMTYESAFGYGYQGTPENWEAFKKEYLDSLPKEGYAEEFAVTPGGWEEPSPTLQELVETGGFIEAPAIWKGITLSADEEGVLSCLKDGKVLSMQMVWPLPTRSLPFLNEVTPEAQRNIDGLSKFFYDLVPVRPEKLAIYTYLGLAGEEEIRWVRFQTEDKSYTFAVRESRFGRWIAAVLDDETIEWCLRPNPVEAMKEKGLHLNVSKAPIEYPLSFYFVPFEAEPIDELVNGDFIAVETLSEKLQQKISGKLGLATLKANVLVNADVVKDHDLYLVFKAVDNFKSLNVTLDKVSPKLPEDGQVALGENPTTIFEWNGGDKKVLVAVKQINNYCNQVNRLIEETRALLSQHPVIQKLFDEKLKVILYAATHFTKRIYGFSAEYGKELVYEVANDVLERLTLNSKSSDDVTRTIGLDLNSWVVWEYTDGKSPVRVTDPEVDFVNTLFNRYTESFIEALYAVLLDTRNPLIKPYDYREIADLSDGIAIGSMRRVK